MPQPRPAADDVSIALGPTIKAAGSQAAFRAVDFDAVVATARAARAAGATRLAVVSALGADPGSSVFYNRVKGEMQAAIAQLGCTSVVIAQPSLLLGDRAAIGQPAALVPRAVRPIAASRGAASLLAATVDAAPGVHRLSSAQMQG